MKSESSFSSYQKLIIVLLALTQFSVILDFMIMSPLGDILMKSMSIKPKQFGLVVSAYAFSAGISGLLTAGFADRFDRKKLFLFFYGGFALGTLSCGFATTYPMLVAARIITGLFGGVIGSISMAIVTDLFSIEQRGRVMGFMQMGFGASQVLGIPIGLYMANLWGWESPFFMIVGVAVILMLLIGLRLQPITAHLAIQRDKSAVSHLWHTIAKRNYRIGFATTALLSIGGFMMMPFGSAFAVNNLGVKEDKLFLLFMVTGVGSLLVMPLIGRLSDKMDRFWLATISTLFMMIMVAIYTHLTPYPLWIIMAFNVVMIAFMMGRMVPAMALITGVPEMADRGAFMSINSALQQIAGGIAAAVGGMIVVQKDKFSPLEHYDIVGWVTIGVSVIFLLMLSRVSVIIKAKPVKPVVQKTEAILEV
ncbi:Predicted arabinose efflux permease, MFS family [Chitinophaga sp. CF118]|uniref:MFS transporter n=1 Tax=Chitinophaga sp. CF118 TaxID=1884367 RepID=UPI0008E0D8C7|nr:MFS transporter [Chitinophaga sp. CF118]SFD89012.1 Predicted arabinose efflux permease, MFS family [Chitinophaga sp. CF118]